MRSSWVFGILSVLITGTATASDFTTKCGKFPEEAKGGYCIHTPHSNASEDIVYHLHGNGGSEATWQEEWYYPAQIREEWRRTNSDLPTVVSFSFGETWLLAEKNYSPYSGLFELFTERLIPFIESQIGDRQGRRIVFGESMGGFNSIQLALKTPMFDKAGILCSPMATVSPFASEEEIRAFIEQSAAWQYYRDLDPHMVIRNVRQIVLMAQGFYPNQKLWEQADPLNLANSPARASTKMYVSIGFYDWTAAYETNGLFVDRLTQNGMNVEWRPQWGGHCAIDIPSLAAFLVE